MSDGLLYVLIGAVLAFLAGKFWDSSRGDAKVIEFKKRHEEIRGYTKQIDKRIAEIKKKKRNLDAQTKKYFSGGDDPNKPA